MTVTADPVVVSQTGTLQVVDSDQGVLSNPDTARAIVEYFAECLSGVHRIAGKFVRINAKVGDDGHLTADLQRVRFGDDDCAVRMVLVASPPVPITPTG